MITAGRVLILRACRSMDSVHGSPAVRRISIDTVVGAHHSLNDDVCIRWHASRWVHTQLSKLWNYSWSGHVDEGPTWVRLPQMVDVLAYVTLQYFHPDEAQTTSFGIVYSHRRHVVATCAAASATLAVYPSVDTCMCWPEAAGVVKLSLYPQSQRGSPSSNSTGPWEQSH
jgi:hypothetical protein